jgi:hypothetical protein
MVPFIVAGVVIGATAVAYLYDRLTDEERELQSDLRERNRAQRERFNAATNDDARNRALKRRRLAESLAGDRREICLKFRELIAAPVREFRELEASLKSSLADITISPYRRNALRLLRARVEDTQNRLEAFGSYCDWYVDRQEWLADRERYDDLIDFPDPSPRLPEDWYYGGKVGLASVSELDRQRNRYGQSLELAAEKLENGYSDAVQRALMLQYPDQEAVPVQLLASRNPRFYKACILRGALYVEHVLEKLPCTAVVTQAKRREGHGDGYWVQCFPNFCAVEKQPAQNSGLSAFLPRSESSFPGKRYLPGERIEVYLHYYDLLLNRGHVTVTQQRESLEFGATGSAPIFVNADGRKHDLHPLLEEADQGAVWSLRSYAEREDRLAITLQLGAWQVDTEAAPGDSQLCVTAIARTGIDSVELDELPFSVRLVERKFKNNVFCDALKFQEFLQFCGQQSRYGEDYGRRNAAGAFFHRWSKVTDYLLEETGYQTFELTPKSEPHEWHWDCSCPVDLKGDLQRLIDKSAFKRQIYLEELHVNDAGERWLRIGELNGLPDALDEGGFRLPHRSIRRPGVEQGYRRVEPGRVRLRFPLGGELANLSRQREALQAFMNGRLLNPALQQILMIPASYVPQPAPFWVERVSAGLQWQDPNWRSPEKATEAKRIVEEALTESNLYLIQGPPGTGKTTCIVELLYQIFATNPLSRVLVVSQQNTAVDNALERYLQRYPEHRGNVVRMGGDASKVQATLHQNMTGTIMSEYLVNRQQDYSRSAALHMDARAAWIGDWIASVCRPGASGQLQFDDELTELLVSDRQLVGSTCVGLASRRHGADRLVFDVCIMDEGGRSTVPEMLIPLMRCRKTIIIGDHFQLPPSVAARLREADAKESLPFLEETFLKTSFFEQLYNNLPEGCRGMLREQFRMVEPIGDLVADLFYTEQDRRGLFNGKIHDRSQFLDPDHPLRWHDVPEGHQAKEHGVGRSLWNVEEANAILNYLSVAARRLACCKAKAEADFKKKSVAIITPYAAQKRLIASKLARLATEGGRIDDVMLIEVDTVDSFQGSEADIVLYSTVRTRGDISFLLDRQRLNVACSRARENLVFFGCGKFLQDRESRGKHPLFSRIIERASRSPTEGARGSSVGVR